MMKDDWGLQAWLVEVLPELQVQRIVADKKK